MQTLEEEVEMAGLLSSLEDGRLLGDERGQVHDLVAVGFEEVDGGSTPLLLLLLHGRGLGAAALGGEVIEGGQLHAAVPRHQRLHQPTVQAPLSPALLRPHSQVDAEGKRTL